jgi:hypothetical protein
MTDPAVFRRTCIHEAGHAVASVVVGEGVEFVSVRPTETFRGMNVSAPPALDLAGFDGFRSVSFEPPALRAGVERHVIMLLAGDLAAWLLGPTPADDYHAASADEALARQALEKLGPRLSELLATIEADTEPQFGDEHNARVNCDAFAGPTVGALYLEFLRASARELVIRYARAIVRVADALERLHVLTGEQVAALV